MDFPDMPEGWAKSGNLLYTGEPDGWRKGKQMWRNRLTVRVDGSNSSATPEEVSGLTTRIFDFLRTPSIEGVAAASDTMLAELEVLHAAVRKLYLNNRCLAEVCYAKAAAEKGEMWIFNGDTNKLVAAILEAARTVGVCHLPGQLTRVRQAENEAATLRETLEGYKQDGAAASIGRGGAGETDRFSNDLGKRLPDAFTNAIGLLEHLGREGVAQHLQQVAKIWQRDLKTRNVEIVELKEELGNLYATIFRDGGHKQNELDAEIQPDTKPLGRPRYVAAVKAYWELRQQAEAAASIPVIEQPTGQAVWDAINKAKEYFATLTPGYAHYVPLADIGAAFAGYEVANRAALIGKGAVAAPPALSAVSPVGGAAAANLPIIGTGEVFMLANELMLAACQAESEPRWDTACNGLVKTVKEVVIKLTELSKRPATPATVDTGGGAATNNGWISVDERLPADGFGLVNTDFVLVARPMAPYNDPVAIAYRYDGEWFGVRPDSDESYEMTGVTHWQPLPAAPQAPRPPHEH